MEFGGLPRQHFACLLADPPWRFSVWGRRSSRDPERHYPTHDTTWIKSLPVAELMLPDSCLFLWFSWPMLKDALEVISSWGFEFKTCAFCWIKADASQIEMFDSNLARTAMGLGFWTRANSEACLLATRGNPKRLNADVEQAIVEPRREHSRKPSCIHPRIERLVAGPYLEVFGRQQIPGWTVWGNETDRFGTVSEDRQMEMFDGGVQDGPHQEGDHREPLPCEDGGRDLAEPDVLEGVHQG